MLIHCKGVSMKRVLVYISVNGIFLALTVLGLFYQVQWALTIALIVAWATIGSAIVLSICITLLKQYGHFPIVPRRSVPQIIDNLFDIAFIIIFAQFGYMVLSAFWLLQLILGNKIVFAKN